jgi:hypothetical protein
VVLCWEVAGTESKKVRVLVLQQIHQISCSQSPLYLIVWPEQRTVDAYSTDSGNNATPRIASVLC